MDTQRKRIILISAAAVVLLLAITFVPMILNNNQESSNQEYSDSEQEESSELDTDTLESDTLSTLNIVPIDGLDEKVADTLPDSRIVLIEGNLFDTIKSNVTENAELNVTDAKLRESSYDQNLQDADKQIYFTTFIVDIPSLKQSYRVNDYYSPFSADVSGLYDYTTLILCLERSELIYGEFNCVDRIEIERGES
jgi:hypothetical protein